MSKVLSSVVASALLVGGITIAAAQDLRGGQTITPQTVPNPDDPAVRDPQSPTASNRGDPGSEALNPNTGGPAVGQGPEPSGTIGNGPRIIGPEGAKNDPHTLGTKDVPIPDPTR